MAVEEEIGKRACIDEYRRDMGGEEQTHNGSMTVQYLECKHADGWASDDMNGTMQPRCEREKCMRWTRKYKDAVMPTDAA